jgi:hypothetical protein
MKTGWSASGKLTTKDSNGEVHLQADFGRQGESKGKAENYTVQFGILYPPPNSAIDPVPVNSEALIQWVVEGNYVTRRVTVVNGQSLTGTGQAVKVSVKDNSIGGGVPVDYEVSIQVTPGTRGGSIQPPTLTPAILPAALIIANGGQLAIPIPQDAGIIAVNASVFAAGVVIAPNAVSVQHLGTASVLKEYDPREAIWVPLAPGSTQVILKNNSGGPVKYSVTFGVDG